MVCFNTTKNLINFNSPSVIMWGILKAPLVFVCLFCLVFFFGQQKWQCKMGQEASKYTIENYCSVWARKKKHTNVK